VSVLVCDFLPRLELFDMKSTFGPKTKLLSFLAIYSIFSTLLSVGVTGQSTKRTSKPLTSDQKIAHVLNRLTFGATPGYFEKVKAIGFEQFIEQQLDPGSIKDELAEAKTSNLEVFKLSTAEIFAKYPNPGALLRMLETNEQANARSLDQNQNNATVSPEDQMKRRQQIAEIYRKYDFKPAQQIAAQVLSNRILRATYSERQLQEVMVDFWQNHFNVFVGKNPVRWYIPSYERDVLRKHALGNFKDLVVGTAQHPAMLAYLDNFENVAPNSQLANANPRAQRFQRQLENGQLPAVARERIKRNRGLTDAQLDQRLKQMQQAGANMRGRGINENYARELMELHTLGVDGGYTQKDVTEVARCFTGWTIADPRGYRKVSASVINKNEDRRYERMQARFEIPDDVESGEFYFNSRWHDGSEKVVLGQKIKEGGMKDGLKVIDLLVKNPATAKFIARKLAVKFVNDNPSEALVSRIAQAFQKSDGDIKTTLRALFNDAEFFAAENYRAKIKTPFELMVSSLRALGADTRFSGALLALARKLGEVPYGYQAPTGYPDSAEDWVNTGALLERMNFAVALSSNRIPQTNVNLKQFEAKTPGEIFERSVAAILRGEVSSETKSALLKQLDKPLPELKLEEPEEEPIEEMPPMQMPVGRRLNRQVRLLPPTGNPEVFKIVGLLLGSPEFQRQ